MFPCYCWRRDYLLYPNYNHVSWSYAAALAAALAFAAAAAAFTQVVWYRCRMKEEVLPNCRLSAGAVGCQGEGAQEPVAGVPTVPAPGPGPQHCWSLRRLLTLRPGRDRGGFSVKTIINDSGTVSSNYDQMYLNARLKYQNKIFSNVFISGECCELYRYYGYR